MKKIIQLSVIIVLTVHTISLRAQLLLPYNGVNYFINGINIPWHNYNNDFGTNYLVGSNYNPAFFDSVLTQCQNYGVNCVRIWLHTNGGTSPEFDSQGYVTGLDTNFFTHLDNFFMLAKNRNIMVIPVIWSFEMMNNDYAWGIYGGMHADLIQDTLKTRSYTNNVLIPMLTRYANQCNLLAWEIINEPEWATDVPGNDASITQHVTMSEMQRFVGMLAETIHLHSPKMCTVGSASLKYNSDISSFPTLCEGNYWKDAAIQLAYNTPLAHLDYYEIHYYDWMNTVYSNFDPYDYSMPYWGLDKLTIVGESKGASTLHIPSDQLYNAYTGYYSGVLFWSFVGGDGNGDFNTVKSALQTFRNTVYTIIDFQGCLTTDNPETSADDNLFKIFPNPASDQIKISTTIPLVFEILDVEGQIIKAIYSTNNETTIDLTNLSKGIYILKAISGKKLMTQKIIIR